MSTKEIHEAPGFKALVARLDELRFKSVRIGNPNATVLIVRVAFGREKAFPLRMEVRAVDRLMRGLPMESLGLPDVTGWIRNLGGSELQKWLSSRIVPVFGSPGSSVDNFLFEEALAASKGLSSVVDSVKKFVDEGHTDRARKSHRVALTLKEVRKAVERAFAEGAERRHVEEILDELLVKEIMES